MSIQSSFRTSSTNSILSQPQVESFVTLCSNTSSHVMNPRYQDIAGKRCHYIGAVPVASYNFNRNVRLSNNTGKVHQSARVAIGMIGAVFGGYAIFKLTQEFKQLKLADKELEKSLEFLNYLKEIKGDCPHSNFHQHKIFDKLQIIAEAHKDIFTKIRRKANITIALLVTMATSAVIALVSSIFSAWAVMTAALSCLAVSGVVLTCKWLFDSADKGHNESAMAINAAVNELNQLTDKKH